MTTTTNPNNVTFFDEESDPQDEVVPTLEQIIQDAMRDFTSELRVTMPAKVLKYNYSDPSVDVQPYFQRSYNTGKIVNMPPLFKVPLFFPSGNNCYDSWPPGETVTLFFCDRSLEAWLSNGAIGVPPDTKQHHLSDAYAIPTGYSFNKSPKISNPSDRIINNGAIEMRLKASGRLQIITGINSPASVELIQILSNLIKAIINARTPTAIGPQPLVNPEFAQLFQQIGNFLEGG